MPNAFKIKFQCSSCFGISYSLEGVKPAKSHTHHACPICGRLCEHSVLSVKEYSPKPPHNYKIVLTYNEPRSAEAKTYEELLEQVSFDAANNRWFNLRSAMEANHYKILQGTFSRVA